MRFLACLLCFIQIAFLNNVHAIVDVKNGNFTTSRIDLDIPAIGYHLRVHRTYNSEPIFFGIFGAGWCSDFETKLIVLSENEILVRQCGNGRDKFYKAGTTSKSTTTHELLREKLLIAFPKEQKKIEGLVEASKTNLPLLATFIDAYKISVKPAVGVVFGGLTGSAETIRYDGKSFLYKSVSDKRTQKFDSRGRLVFEGDSANNSLTYARDTSGRVSEVRHSSGAKLNLRYNSDGRVAKAIAPNNVVSTYDYDKFGNLANVKGSRGAEAYQYSTQHKLLKIGTDFQIQYDKDGRNVTAILQKNCREDFSYVHKGEIHSVKSVLKCKNSPARNSNYVIEIASGAQQPRVEKISTTINGRAADKFEYNSNGLPLLVRTPSSEARYVYNKSQRLEAVSLGDQNLRFEYSPGGLVRRLLGSNLKSKKENFKISYKYNSSNRITEYSADGETVKLKYDFLGRMTQIGRSRTAAYEIAYAAQSSQPREISLRGKGRVNLLARDYRSLASDKKWIGLESASSLLTDYQALQQPLRLVSLSSVGQ